MRAARAFTLKNYALAIRHLDELLEHVGENPHTLYALALCHARQGQRDEALAAARRALDADAHHLESLKLLARMHFLRGEHAQARPLAARALILDRALESAPATHAGGARAWLAALTGVWRTPRDGLAFLAAGEHRQWREWAEAYLAPAREADGGTC